MPTNPQAITNLDEDEHVVLFPSLGFLEPSGRVWQLQIQGDVFSYGKIGFTKKFLLSLLLQAMRAPKETLDDPTFKSRIDRFLAVDERGKRLAVRIGSQVHLLPKLTSSTGHFSTSLRLDADVVDQLRQDTSGLPDRLTLGIRTAEGNERVFPGCVHLIEPEGVSIISDIDDTLKHSQVLNKRTLLANTFLHKFQPITGMADLFRGWAAEGAAFHYVSSCPWQLYRHLADHFAEEGLPPGSFHLRSFRLRDHLIQRLLMLRRSGKSAVIQQIIKMYPRRRFFLIGDAGEADPEIYGAMARKFPQQVARVLIREVDGPRNTARRFAKAFRNLPPDIAATFRDASEIKVELGAHV